MKIDTETTFIRIMVPGKGPLNGEFQIVQGSGQLASELFVVGTARTQLPDGTKVSAEVVYPFEKIEALILEDIKPEQEEE